MMEGDPRIDRLMRPVLAAIERHVKDSDAKTEIYNRAYEALLESMNALDASVKVTAKQIAENAKNLQRAEAAEAKVAELEAAARWIPVTEKLPEKDGTYIGWCGKENFYAEFTFSQCWTISIDKRITHWMPLPQPPQEVKE